MKKKKFLKSLAISTVLILLIILCHQIYITNILLKPVKANILSNTEQISILRGEMQEVKLNIGSTLIEIYDLEKELSIQREHVRELEFKLGSMRNEIK